MNGLKIFTNPIITITAVTAGAIYAAHIIKRRYQIKQPIWKAIAPENKYYYEAIFFDHENIDCRGHLLGEKTCGKNCSFTKLQKILHFISSATSSIDLCMYMLTLKRVTDVLIRAKEKGVKIRIISDREMASAKASKDELFKLLNKGIPIKMPSKDHLMHMKQCLIDASHPVKARACFGSFNLTLQAACMNFEAMILTNDRDYVRQSIAEFDWMWDNFEPYVCEFEINDKKRWQ